jgi:hypothetical protein
MFGGFSMAVSQGSHSRTRSGQGVRSALRDPQAPPDSPVSTIAISFPLAKRGQSPQQTDLPRHGFLWLQRLSVGRASGTSTTPVSGSMVQRGLNSKEHP